MRLNRTLYRSLLILSFLAVNAIIVAGISAVFSYLNTGADRSAMLHLAEECAPGYLPKVEWSPLKNEGRPMEPTTLQELERDYLKAWQRQAIAMETNENFGIADYYTDSARVKLYAIIERNKRNGVHFKTTTLGHQPTLEFYSTDGKIVVLTDRQVERYNESYMNGNLVARTRNTTSYKVMLLLEDGFWRIRHMTKLPSKKVLPVARNSLDLSAIRKIRGINYYPKKNPWNMYGDGFKDSIVRSDFEKIRSMGLNTVRIFIPYESFGKTEVDSEKIVQLKQTLDLAEKNNLQVMITLFDFYGDYSLRDWTLTHRHAEQVVLALKNHKALLAWDIKNEPDLDFDSRGEDEVKAWLREMISQVKSWDDEHPVTIGWSSPEAALHLSEEVDFVSFHYYRQPKDFLVAFKQLKSAVPEKALVLQEYGYSSYDGIWNAFLGSEEDQAEYYREMQRHLSSENLPSLFWTLYDYESVPNSVVGLWPWRKGKQRHFGLIKVNGEEKKAYRVLTETKE